MKIGVVSDTHDHLENIERAFELLSKEHVNMVCHLGDWVAPFAVDCVSRQAKKLGVPLKGVFGNNDGEIFMIVSSNPDRWKIDLGQHTLQIDAEDRKIILYHGTDQKLTAGLIASGAYDAVFSGHTHSPRNELKGRTLDLNPGTLSGFSGERGGKITTGELAVYDSAANTARLLSFPL